MRKKLNRKEKIIKFLYNINGLLFRFKFISFTKTVWALLTKDCYVNAEQTFTLDGLETDEGINYKEELIKQTKILAEKNVNPLNKNIHKRGAFILDSSVVDEWHDLVSERETKNREIIKNNKDNKEE